MMDSAVSRLARHAALLVKDLPAPTRDALCLALEQAGATESSILGCVTQPGTVEDVRQLLSLTTVLEEKERFAQLALMLRAARAMDALHRDGESIDLVWTGPNPPRSALFRTEQTLLDLIRNAKKTILVVTYAAYKVDAVRAALASALDRGVYVKLVVELDEEDGGGVSFSPFHALKKRGESRMAVFAWPLEKRPKGADGKQGSLHAKCAVADDDVLLVSSANLTSYALELNMELGVLVTGGDAPRRVREHFEELVRRRILQELEP
jgi:phosphatidylserine/phosphatidylglycerophosphate/cardiolipin synthase-like enzyme